MIFRFDDFCEKWAQCYLPLSHNPSRNGKGCRFFRHDTLDERVAFVQKLLTLNEGDLIMSVITAFDGELTARADKTRPGFINWRRHILFWARQEGIAKGKAPMDDRAAADAKARAMEAALDFVAFLSHAKDPHKKAYIKELSGVHLDELELVTLPVSFNGWWAACINFDQEEQRQKCLTETSYSLELAQELFPNVDWETNKEI